MISKQAVNGTFKQQQFRNDRDLTSSRIALVAFF